jgi:hypothetical protein
LEGKGMITVTLPEIPKGKEFEEGISAFFQAGSYCTGKEVGR